MTKRLPQLRKSGDCSPLTQAVLIAALALLLLGVGTVSAQGKRTLAGRVVDQSGTGVTGVRVWVLRGNPVAAEAVADCLTDSHGRFSIGPLSVSSQPEQTPGWGVTQVREFDVLRAPRTGVLPGSVKAISRRATPGTWNSSLSNAPTLTGDWWIKRANPSGML